MAPWSTSVAAREPRRDRCGPCKRGSSSRGATCLPGSREERDVEVGAIGLTPPTMSSRCVFQVHGVDAAGRAVLERELQHGGVLPFLTEARIVPRVTPRCAVTDSAVVSPTSAAAISASAPVGPKNSANSLCGGSAG